MQVLHDWNDHEAALILSAIRRAAPTHAKLLLIEGVVPDDASPSWIKMLDIFMLAMLTGKERTRREFEGLLDASGFRLGRVIDTGLATSMLEAGRVVLDVAFRKFDARSSPRRRTVLAFGVP